MPSQRPTVPFLSSFLAAFRQQSPQTLSTQQPKPHSQASSSNSYANGAATATRAISGTASAAAAAAAAAAATTSSRTSGAVVNQLPLHAASRSGMPIPGAGSPGRRRGSDSSSEGFRDVLGNEKWYIGGRTAGGEERFFKVGVVRRVRSNDGLSLDRLSL